MKKRLAAVLALMMLLSLTIPALAQDDQPVVLEFMAISDWPDAVYPAIADAFNLYCLRRAPRKAAYPHRLRQRAGSGPCQRLQHQRLFRQKCADGSDPLR